MGLFSRLFGNKNTQPTQIEVEPIEYKGFLIYQEAIGEGGQFRIAGRITKEIDGEVKPTNLYVLICCQLKVTQMNLC